MVRRFYILMSIVLFLVAMPSCAQYFKLIGVQDGMPNSTVKALVQDHRGFIWMGTFNGLCRYDGVSFITYRNVKGEGQSLSDSHIESLYPDRNGIWTGTVRGLDFLSFDDGRFHHACSGGKVIHESFLQLIHVQGRLIALTAAGNVFVQKSKYDFTNCFPSRHVRIRAIAAYKSHGVLMMSGKYLWIYDLKKRKVVSTIAIHLTEELNDEYALYFSEKQNLVYVGFGINTPSLAFRVDSHLQLIPVKTYVPSSLKEVVDFDGATVFARDCEGLTILRNGKFQTFTPQNSSISSDAIHSLLVDKEHNLWIGTYREGVNILTKRYSTFRSLSLADSHLSSNVVTAVLERDGIVYVGTDGGGLNIYDRRTRRLEVLSTKRGNLPGDNVLSLSADKDYLWMAIYGKGLYRYSFSARQVQEIPIYNPKGLPYNNIWQILSVDNDHLWVVGRYAGIYDKHTGIFRAINGIASERVNSICYRNNTVWMSSDQGIFQVSRQGKILKHIHGFRGGDNVGAMFVESGNRIWFSVNGRFGMLDAQSLLIHYYGQSSGLSDTHVVSIAMDRKRNLWLGTEKGLFRLDPYKKSFTYFGKDDHIGILQYCDNSCYYNGRDMYFGGTDGLVCFNPDEIITTQKSNKVYFDAITLINGGVVLPLTSNSRKVSLKYDQNFFDVSFSVPTALTSSKVKVKCKLENFDTQWKPVEHLRRVSYTNVPPGKYIFLVKATDESGNWSSEPSALTIVVCHPWWNTLWADVLWLLLVVTAIYAVLSFYFREQKKKIARRRRELEWKMKDRLEEEKMNFFSGITHELRTPMFLIAAPIEELLQSSKRPVQVPYSYLEKIYKNVQRFNLLVNRIVDIRKLNTEVLALRKENGDVVEFCRKLAVDYEALCHQKDITFSFNTPYPALKVDFDHEKVELILSNLVSNAFKYTQVGGSISLNISWEEGRLLFDVVDTGMGIKKEDVGKIFDRYFRSDSARRTKGDGLGLAFVKELVKVMDGDIHVESIYGKGSDFSFTIPVQDVDMTEERTIEDVEKKVEISDNTLPTRILQTPAASHLILIIDDEKETQDLLERYLSTEYRVIKADNGKQGLEMALEHLPDLVICDVMMPVMNGFEFLQQLRKEPRFVDLPVIMFTAKILDEDKLSAYEYGADAYITKPVSLRYLKARIHALLIRVAQKKAIGTDSGIFDDSHCSVEDKKFIMKLKDVVMANLSNDCFDVALLTKTLNMSHSALYKRVKNITGKSVIDFINDYRIHMSIQLFTQGETNITKVAEECGFNDIRSFRAAFKARMNVAPKQYLQNM